MYRLMYLRDSASPRVLQLSSGSFSVSSRAIVSAYYSSSSLLGTTELRLLGATELRFLGATELRLRDKIQVP